MVGIFEALAERMHTRRKSHNDTLVAAARRLANGESCDDAAVDAALQAVGQTVDDFRGLVELCQRRRGWYTAMDRGPAAATALAKLNDTMARERAAFEQVQQAWFARSRELDEQVRVAETTANAARDARDKLLDPANVPGELADRIRQAHNDVAVANDVVDQNRREHREAVEREKSQRDWAREKRELNRTTHGGDADDHERFAARAARRVAELDAALPEAERVAAAAAAELKRLEAAALKI